MLANRKSALYLFFLVVAFICAGTVSLYAQTWTGATNTAWNTGANWSGGSVPASGATVTIPTTTNKPVISSTINLSGITIGNWSSPAVLTVSAGGTLNISNSLSFNGGGQLHIEGGSVNHTGTSFSMAYNDASYIEMASGSFESNANINLDGGNNTTQPAFSAGNGTAVFNGNLTVSSSKIFETENGNITVNGTLSVNGLYNGNDGISTFNGTASIGSGGVMDLDSGTLNFNEATSVSNNGKLYLGTGIGNFADDINVQSSGYIYVEDGEMNVTGNATFSNNGNLSSNGGSVNVGGNASLSSGGSIDLNSGSLSVGGNASFTNGGTVNAGSANINLQGDFSVESGGSFNSGTSTVTFSGNETQTINTGGNDITFYNVVVESGASVQTDGSAQNTITVENNLTVEEGGTVSVEEDDTIDIQGDLEDEGGGVVSEKPFVVLVTTPSLTSVLITFDKAMDETIAETTGNYSINNGITVSNAVLSPSDPKKVTLTVSTMTQGIEYEVTMNNLESTDGGLISTNHKKRFTTNAQVNFYSRQNGNWAVNSTWSTTGHGGSSASSNPGATDDAIIIIGNGHTVTVASSATITDQNSVSVNSSSKLLVGSGGILELGTDVISGAGTFEVGNGTIEIGSTAGIRSSGASGNIQTTSRTFGSSGSYTYNGSSAQVTGSGLPSEVNNLKIDNSSDVTASDDIEVSGTLYLTDGSLILEPGLNLIANTKNISSGNLVAQQNISGSRGWRLLSSPLSTDFDDLLDATVTQGYTGAYYSTGSFPGDTLQPNVLYYDESHPGTDNQRWRAPGNASSSVSEGLGIYTYFFGDIAADSRYNIDLPLTLSVEGQENSGTIDFGVTYTTSADSGWNLVGNPYASTIDWDDNANWTKTNMDNSIYVWDPSASQYKTWNGTTGDLGDGLIAPFQGFWVKANAASPELEVTEDAKTFGDTFLGKQITDDHNSPMISLKITNQELQIEATTHLMFSESAKIGKDVSDAYRLVPPPGILNYLDMTTIADGNRLAINNLPRHFGQPIEIPIYINAYQNGYETNKTLTLSFSSLENIPAGWQITIIDNVSKTKINPDQQNNYQFNQSGSVSVTAPNANFGTRPKITAKKGDRKPRFTVRIHPGEDAEGLPDSYELKQNYPNPFNPTTNIEFTLPLQSPVELSIFNILGRKVATLVNEELPAGSHSYHWDALNLSSGIYLYRLITPGKMVTNKMTLIK